MFRFHVMVLGVICDNFFIKLFHSGGKNSIFLIKKFRKLDRLPDFLMSDNLVRSELSV